jgi:plastocyanin
VLSYDGYEPFSADVNHLAHGGEAPPPGVVRAPRGPVGSAATPTPAPAPSGTSPSATATAPSSASPAAGTTIVEVDNHFMPSKLTVTAGTTVTWMNNGTNFHTTTSFDGLWDSGVKGHGEAYSFTFDKPGTYKFYCRQHILQGMSGTITVTPP